MSSPILRATIAEPIQMPAAPDITGHRLLQIRLLPADIGSGIRISRLDVGRSWAVHSDNLAAARNCTAIGDAEFSVAFVEHLLAALRAFGISDVVIETNGPQIPLYDGSARVFWEALQQAGRKTASEIWEPLCVKHVLAIQDGRALLQASPGAEARMEYILEHPHPLIGRQHYAYGAQDDFGQELAWARTFATAEEIQALYGVAPTPAMEEACVIVYPDHISGAPLPPQAFARHKLVDLLGDLFLCGRPILGHIHAFGTGHRHNHQLVRKLAALAE